MAFLTWLAGTKGGRWAAGLLASLIAMLAVALKLFAAGRAAEKRTITDDSLRAAASRKDAADAVRSLDIADVRRRLRPWSRKN